MATPSWLPNGWFPGDSLPIVPGTALDDIINLIARRVRRKAESGSNLQVEIISEVVHAQRKLEEGPTLPWFLREEATTTASASTGKFSLDDTGYSIIRLQDDKPVAYQDPAGKALENVEVYAEAELKILHGRYPGTAEVPRGWFLDDKDVVVRPIPTQSINYVLRFYHHDTEPVLGEATLWTANFPDLIMNMAGFEIAWSLRDNEATTRFETNLARARDKFVKAVEAREQAGQDHVMGD